MDKWIVQDWAGNVFFGGKEFDSFEEGWDYIYVNDPEPDEKSPEWKDHWFDDYYVVRKYRQVEVEISFKVMVNTDEVDSLTTIEDWAISAHGLNDYERQSYARVTWVGDPR